MKGAVCKRIYDEVIAENKKLKEENESLNRKMNDCVSATAYNELLNENADQSAMIEELKEELKFSHDCRCSARDAYESVIKKVGDENKKLKEEIDSLQKSNQQKNKAYHRFKKQVKELQEGLDEE